MLEDGQKGQGSRLSPENPRPQACCYEACLGCLGHLGRLEAPLGPDQAYYLLRPTASGEELS